MKKMLWFAVVLVAGTVGLDAARADELWTVDYEAAQAAAEKEGKDILMEFTGSDWCPPCIALKKNVLDKDEFQKEAPKHFILLKLDNPNDKSKQSEKEIQQYRTMAGKFNVAGVPTIILADAKGRPYAKLVGYSSTTTAEAYTNRLVEKISARKVRDESFAKAKDAKGAERAKLLAKAVEGIDSELVVSEYRDTLKEIIELDAENAAGLKGKYEGLLKTAELKARLKEIQTAARKDPEGAPKRVDALIEELKLEGPSLQEALYTKAVLLYAGDKAASREALEKALAAAPDGELASRIKGFLANAFKDAPKKEGEKGNDEQQSKEATKKKSTAKR
jgi:thioredoxin-related protein